MPKRLTHSNIYRSVVSALESGAKDRQALIAKCVESMGFSREELADKSTNSIQNITRSRSGALINEMLANGIIALGDDKKYSLVAAKPVAVRLERCESEIFKALAGGPMSKAQLREHLNEVLGANKTATKKDDDRIYDFVGQILKRLTDKGHLVSDGSLYSIAPRLAARTDDVAAMLTLKSEFISRLHKHGGEFFENYFMALLEKYVEKHGKTVTEGFVVGGSEDGGIDGILKTTDALGFRETIMVQTKNRTEITNETDVRGFYGAVCARQGSRGIYAITSDFHAGATKFLDAIDNCVGINGNKLFKMAIECAYGIKKSGDSFVIDEKII